MRREQRQERIRRKISGSQNAPRLSVFRSSKHIWAQLINDEKGVTLASASDLNLKVGTKLERAAVVGEKLAQEASKKKIKKAVFDRGGFRYHGRIKALAEGARKGGLEF